MTNYKADKKGIDFVHSFESLSLKPYLCPAGVPTIGWGNTWYPNGKKVTMKDSPITKERADEIFEFVKTMFEKELNTILPEGLTQNQFNALFSFAYNVGTDIDADDIPEGLGDSRLLKLIIADKNNKVAITAEFQKWCKSNGKPSAGLLRRRTEEAKMFYQ